jgi:hypothetical protein
MGSMTRGFLGATLLVAASGGAALAASSCDLFHSTNFATLCDVDPSAAPCTDAKTDFDAASPPATNFCDWTPATARTSAAHACAWLSACELPLGTNDFGPCMISALLAYDCSANASLPVTGALHAYWDVLWQARSCGDVDRAVFPGAGAADEVPVCDNGGGFTACGVAYDGGDNSGVRVECDEAGTPARGENCVAQGRTCANGSCVVAPSAAGCMTGCAGTVFHECADGGEDDGVDCAGFGAGSCATASGAEGCAGMAGAACTPTAAIGCDGGVAQGCLAGTTASVDCNALTGQGSCNAGNASPGWDLSSACFADAGTCPPDSCADAGDVLVSCARGAAFTVSCSGATLGPCGAVMTVDGLRAACGRP